MLERCCRLAAVALAAALACPPASAASRVPRSHFDFADRCLTASAGSSRQRHVATTAKGYALARRGGEPLFFKATGLGTYMVGDTAGRLMTTSTDGAVTRGTQPGPHAEWRARRARAGVYDFVATTSGRLLAIDGITRFRFTRARSCRPY